MTARRPLRSAVLEDSAWTMVEVLGLCMMLELRGGKKAVMRDAKVDAFAISG